MEMMIYNLLGCLVWSSNDSLKILVMINSMCQLIWIKGFLGIWLLIISTCLTVRVFPDETGIRLGSLSKADRSPNMGRTLPLL